MEDVLTEIPPPSRFFQEELNNFTPPSPPLPSPFLVFSNPKLELPLQPSLLIIALSAPSLYAFHHVPLKTLIGGLFLPETHFAGNSVSPSPTDKSCNIYALSDVDNPTLVVCVQCPVSAERANIVAKLLIGEQIIPKKVLILDSFKSQNFRGKLSPDETYAFKLESYAEKKFSSGGCSLLKGIDYFPSGSVVDGLAAALLAQCQMKITRGTLCVSWPEYGGSALTLVKGLLHKNLSDWLDLSFDGDDDDKDSRFGCVKDHPFDCELYT
ncbi:hypothetical protein K2173_015230 [Erythroxylum novogranatense]|uniref:Proteasome assembly chaperone 1 n=1 Tax=Erythroxylum novogranatense TaxID=1862640 RepID=A0AAV8T2S5_9ROSI|nr:hypothetical protein K2173_015230 [Erythroxylum novogranatense]